MNKKILGLLLACTIGFSSCEDWLTQEDATAISIEQAYSSVTGISSIASNLYSRLRYDQDFTADDESYDLTRWDEAINNSQYWAFATNVGNNYREYYDYTLVREINLHIKHLKTKTKGLTEQQERYFLAEARYIRAYVYFTLVSRMGGVPILEEAFDYTTDASSLRRARNKESEVYDFIARELDAITEDLALAKPTKTRATKGSALALKCRAMLYAGTIASNYDINVTKGLVLASGATGIEKSKAAGYLEQCIAAYKELKKAGFALYSSNPDLAANYYEAFTVSPDKNQELIFCKAYDGNNFLNNFTRRAIGKSFNNESNSGCQINPVLNQVNCYERLSTRRAEELQAYVGTQVKEEMQESASSLEYVIYDHPQDIFADRDPRLAGSILYPGSTFRGKTIEMQAGLAVKAGSGFEFKSAPTIEDVANPDKGFYAGVQMTALEGPHYDSYYVSHSGFLMRKFVDSTNGSEFAGASKTPYVVFRYGEAVLNAAEAAYLLNENGVGAYDGEATLSIALNCINEVRGRAGGETFKISAAELTYDRIKNERRVELSFEDHRYNDMKRWRTANEEWNNDRNNDKAVTFGLWPYKIYAPGEAIDGKWLYRKVLIRHRGGARDLGAPISFGLGMYYAIYPMNSGNPLIEKNPNH